MRHGAVAAYAGLVWVTTSSSSHGPRAARGCDQFLRSEWAIRHFYRYTAQSTFNRKMRVLLSDGHSQQLHVVGAVVTTSASPGHRESVCTSSVMCG